MNRKSVGILVFDEVEVLDFCGPFEVFSATRLNEEKRREESSPFNTFLVAESREPVVTTGGMKVLPAESLWPHPSVTSRNNRHRVILRIRRDGSWQVKAEAVSALACRMSPKTNLPEELLLFVLCGIEASPGASGLLCGQRS